MNPKRYETILNGLTSVARKVLNAVSTETAMSPVQVYRELIKLGTPVKNLYVVEGCLGSLGNSNLLREDGRGYWLRLPVPQPTEGDSVNEATAEAAAEAESAPSTVVDHSEAFAGMAESLEERWKRYFPSEPMPEPQQAAQLLAYVPAGEEAYRVEMVENTEPHDPHYEAYLLARSERTIEILQLLSEQVDDEIGLALLEIAEEIAETSGLEMEYFISINEKWQRRVTLNPGYYQHELPNGSVIFNQVESVPPDVLAAYMERQQEMVHSLTPPDPEWLEANRRDDQRHRKALLAEFETDNEPRHEFVDKLMERLRTHVSDIESPANLELPQLQAVSVTEAIRERKTRHGLCDIDLPGISMTPEYRAWGNLNSRQSTAAYGVEESWKTSLRALIKDVGYQPAPNARLTRKDKAQGWFKANVEWRLEGHALPGRSTAPKGWPVRQRLSSLPKHEL